MDKHPEAIGRYKVESVIGRGAMGVIYRAHDPEIDRTVAIKLVRSDLLSSGERSDYILRFRREAQAAGRCVHPNIVTIYDLALHDGNPFIAMEFIEGRSLDLAYPRGTSWPPEEAVSIILQVLDALAAAHQMGVVHRDIKPSNILLADNHQVKVTDFGISRINSSELTGDGQMIGTPSYMSPEQCLGLAIDARSDLFSIGVVLYELLCGLRPFAGSNPTVVIQRVLNEEPVDLCFINSAISPALQIAVRRALAKSPDARYASAAEMMAALRAVPDLSTSNIGDHTAVVIPKRGAVSAGTKSDGNPSQAGTYTNATEKFDPAILATIERKLASHVGPIARVILKSAAQPGTTLEKLCELLAANIPTPQERERFRIETLAELQCVATAQAGAAQDAVAGISPAELVRVEKELTRYLGPIARVLVRREAKEASAVPELWQRLSCHIERSDERGNFLRRLSS